MTSHSDRNPFLDPPAVEPDTAAQKGDTVRLETLELMSTQRLNTLLAEEHAQHHDAVRQIAESSRDGYLARDSATGHFKVIDDDELQALLDTEPEKRRVARPAPAEPAAEAPASDELSLVSTQRLRKILDIPESTAPGTKKPVKTEPGGGFNPYDHS